MRLGILRRAIALATLLAAGIAQPSFAQQGATQQDAAPSAGETALSEAFDHEMAGRRQEAVDAYLRALRDGADTTQTVFGLERVYAELGWTDSIAPLLETLIASNPREAAYRGIQLRALRMSGRPDEADAAFERWVALDRNDGAPYRAYSRLLLEAGETAAADSVLRRARAALGGSGTVALELAQTRAAMGLWHPSAVSWRQALEREPYLADAASFALAPTPPDQRTAVSAVFSAPPVDAAARQTLAALHLGWGDPFAAWRALRTLPPDDSSATSWLAFADQAEAGGAWPAARDALLAVLAVKPSLLVASRAANAALEAGDAAAALAATERVSGSEEPRAWAQLVLPVRVRALGALGRPADAAREVAASDADSVTRARLHREVAYAWVQSGDMSRARDALDASGAAPDDEVRGWLALYEGDLASAREGLRTARDQRPRTVLARAFLSRTRADRAPHAGAAFLALARSDSAESAVALERAASELPETTSLFLTAAARLHAAAGRGADAERLWREVIEDYSHSAEAPEAALAWARHLMSEGDSTAAVERLEQLILTWPRSALVPQARRTLDLARGRVVSPPAAPAPRTTPPEIR